MCDVLYVYESDARGRAEGETANLIRKGAAESGHDCAVEVIMKEKDAVDRAMADAVPGDFLLLLVDDITGTTERLKGRSFPVQSDLTQA
jgi:cyanophycin synthetase